MKNNLLTDFTVNKKNNIIKVRREFTSPGEHVWAAWTKQKLLDQWWAPEPWISKTKKMDFREGGQRLYAMIGPEGEKHWSLAVYKSITPKTDFKYLDCFCDSNGNINREMPQSDWSVHFSELSNSTAVSIEIKFEKLSDLKKLIEMGFKEGLGSAFENLDEILKNRS